MKVAIQIGALILFEIIILLAVVTVILCGASSIVLTIKEADPDERIRVAIGQICLAITSGSIGALLAWAFM